MRSLLTSAILLSLLASAPPASAHDGHSRVAYAPVVWIYPSYEDGCGPDLFVNPIHCGIDDGDRATVQVTDLALGTVWFTWTLYCNTPSGPQPCDGGIAYGAADFATPPTSAYVDVKLDGFSTAGYIDYIWYHGT